MESRTVRVPNVGCNGCINTIKNEVTELAGVMVVSGDPNTKLVTIEWDNPADWSAIKKKMVEIDYAPQGA